MQKKFAAKYKFKWQGWVAIVFGAAFLSGAINARNGWDALAGMLFGLPLLLLGIYLLRGEGLSPSQEARRKLKADRLQGDIDNLANILKTSSGGAAVVAYRNLEKVVKKTKDPNAETRLKEILASIAFDQASIESHFIGAVPIAGAWGNKKVEIYKNWIIADQESFDVDVSTRAEVHVDGGVTFDKKNNRVDTRTAALQFVSTDWAKSFNISPDNANSARTIASQLMAVIETLKPKGVSTADISELVNTVLNNSGQPAAQKLQQLSDLRYQRLLTDDEFEAAKAKVLGI